MNQNHKRRLSRTAVLVISGVIVWPLWFGLLACVGIFTEEVLGWKDAYLWSRVDPKDGSDWNIWYGPFPLESSRSDDRVTLGRTSFGI